MNPLKTNRNEKSTRWIAALAASIISMILCDAALAQVTTVNLKADETIINLPDPNGGPPVPVTMWAFGRCPTPGGVPDCNLGTVSVPGPEIIVPAANTTLIINLTNLLPEPISIYIPGLGMPSVDGSASLVTTGVDGQGRTRVRAFSQETAPNQTRQYLWTGLRPGTFLYQSGSHSAVQVQMGLYGMMRKSQNYTGNAVDRHVPIIFSEVDTALHAAVAGGTYGTSAYPSTIDYHPEYYLVNGLPYAAGTHEFLRAETAGGGLATINVSPGAGGASRNRVQLRFINAGLQTHVPEILGYHFRVIAEDGNLYPFAREQSSFILPAGKTVDATITVTRAEAVPIFDRRLNMQLLGKLNVLP